MNTGIGDAFDIGWKLAATLKGYAGPALLESYDRERRAVGLRNCQAAWRHMTVRFAIGKVYEDLANSGHAQSEAALAEAGVRIKALGNAENESYGIEMGYCYADSPVVRPSPTSTFGGTLLPTSPRRCQARDCPTSTSPMARLCTTNSGPGSRCWRSMTPPLTTWQRLRLDVVSRSRSFGSPIPKWRRSIRQNLSW